MKVLTKVLTSFKEQLLFKYKLSNAAFDHPYSDIAITQAQFSVFNIDRNISRNTFSQSGIDIPDDFIEMSRKRKCEFLVGRMCAQQALWNVGEQGRGQVTRSKASYPVWPKGFCGSISHTSGLAIACAAKAKNYHALGIDIETLMNDQTANEVSSLVLLDSDRLFKKEIPFNQFVTLIFSAKEALFKAINHDVGYVFGFEEVAVVHINHQLIQFKIQGDLSERWVKNTLIEVRYNVAKGRVISLVVIK